MSATENTETIFMACPSDAIEQIYPGFWQFFRNFYPYASKYHKIRELDLPDIWTRDFLPVWDLKKRKIFPAVFYPAYMQAYKILYSPVRHTQRRRFADRMESVMEHCPQCDLISFESP